MLRAKASEDMRTLKMHGMEKIMLGMTDLKMVQQRFASITVRVTQTVRQKCHLRVARL